MSIKDIIDNPDLPWDMSIVCEFNKYLTINDIIKYPNYLNCWSSLSCHANITFNDILPYQNLPWQYDYFSDRVDYKTAIEHDDKPWRWEVIIKNNELEELSIMKDKLLILFNSNYNRKSCTFISCNKTIKLDDIKNYKLDWDYGDLATYIIKDKRLSVGAEMKIESETEKYHRKPIPLEVDLGPSIQWRPTDNTHLDIVPLIGFTKDSPQVEAWFVFGIDIGKKDKNNRQNPISSKSH